LKTAFIPCPHLLEKQNGIPLSRKGSGAKKRFYPALLRARKKLRKTRGLEPPIP
jgi:hypothetical protein